MKLNQDGLGLVQVMFAIAAVGGFTYAILQNNSVSNKQLAKASFDQHLETQVEEIQTELAKLENCTATLKDKIFSASPATIPSIKKGVLDTSTVPPGVIVGPNIFNIKKPNSIGVYINSINILTRTEVDPLDPTRTWTNDVIRVQFNSGDVNNAGVARDRASGLGATQITRDFVIQSSKQSTGQVITCFSDSSNVVENSCESIPDTVWNPTTKRCEFPNAIPKSDLVQLWITKDGTIAYNKPADAPNGEVTCQKSGKRCSRTGLDCTLPACPANHYHSGAWEWDRKQSTWDYACMKSANCMYMAQRAGWLVKP